MYKEAWPKQHDNSWFMKTWFAKVGVEQFTWPAQSPDLNLIEDLQDELELLGFITAQDGINLKWMFKKQTVA